MENEKLDFVENEGESIENDFVELDEGMEEQENINIKVPFGAIAVGIVERATLSFIKEDEKKQEFISNYESQCLPLLEMIKFDDVVARKFLQGKGLTDNQVIMFGAGAILVTGVLNALPYVKFKKKGKKEQEEMKEGD